MGIAWNCAIGKQLPKIDLEPRDTIISFRYFGVWFHIESKRTGKSRGTVYVKPNFKMFKQDVDL